MKRRGARRWGGASRGQRRAARGAASAWVTGLVACAFLQAGCSGSSEPRPSRPPLFTVGEEPRASTPLASEGARWVFHPASGAVERASWVGDSARLAVGENGERWLTRAGEPPRGSPFAAPESLIDVGRVGERYAVVGSSGAAYLAEEPLGPFVAVRSPPHAFVAVSSRGGALAAVTSDGTLFSGRDFGARWRSASGPSVQVVDVALAAEGRGLALAVPETWLETEDGGQSWTAANLPSVGARRLTVDTAGHVVVDGLFRRARLSEGRWVTEPARGSARLLATDLGPAPRARALEARSAFLDGKRYVALERSGTPNARKWQLLRGELGGRLESRDVPELAPCRELTLAGAGRHLAVLCAESSAASSSGPLRFFTSGDGGETFRPREVALRGIVGQLRVAVDTRGVVLATGLCAPHLTATGCAPRGTYRFEPGDERQLAVALPGLSVPAALAWGSPGRAYAAGARDKDGRLWLYVSEDGGKSFRPTPDELLPVVPQEGLRSDDDVRLAVDDEGVVSLVSYRSGRALLVTTDARGRVLSAGEAPGGARSLSAVGLHALAVQPETNSIWESFDGGASWELLAPPRSLCMPRVAGERECELPLQCGIAGCVLGSALSRLGWGSRGAGNIASLPAVSPEGGAERRYKTPLACTLSRQPWQVVPGLSDAPRAADAALGSTMWGGVGVDAESGAVWAVHAAFGTTALTQKTLLAPVSEPTRYALAVLPQVEGSVALRYVVPRSSRRETHISDVEVAWDNRLESVVALGRWAGPVAPLPGDFSARASRTLQAEPALLSIASGGVYLRLHKGLGDRQPTYFFDGRGVHEVPSVPWPDALLRESRTEMMRIDERDVPVAFAEEGAVLASAHRTSQGFDLNAVTLGHPNAIQAGLVQSVSIAYTDKKPGFLVIQSKPTGTWWKAYSVLPSASSAPGGLALSEPRAVPLQADLPDPPAPCSDDSRKRDARIVSPAFPGNPHPVVISDASEADRVLVTERAVLHGSPKSPCVAVFDAVARSSGSALGAAGRGAPRVSALVPLGDLAHAWAFQVARLAEGQVTVQARPMSCRFDESLTIPRELLPELGSSSHALGGVRGTTGAR